MLISHRAPKSLHCVLVQEMCTVKVQHGRLSPKSLMACHCDLLNGKDFLNICFGQQVEELSSRQCFCLTVMRVVPQVEFCPTGRTAVQQVEQLSSRLSFVQQVVVVQLSNRQKRCPTGRTVVQQVEFCPERQKSSPTGEFCPAAKRFVQQVKELFNRWKSGCTGRRDQNRTWTSRILI